MDKNDEWVQIKKYPDFEASRLGKIRNSKSKLERKFTVRKGKESFGRVIGIKDKSGINRVRSVAKIIYEAFNPGKDLPEGEKIRFLDGNPENYAISNLGLESERMNIVIPEDIRILRNHGVSFSLLAKRASIGLGIIRRKIGNFNPMQRETSNIIKNEHLLSPLKELDPIAEWRYVSTPEGGVERKYAISTSGIVFSFRKMHSIGIKTNIHAGRKKIKLYHRVVMINRKIFPLSHVIYWSFVDATKKSLYITYKDKNALNCVLQNLNIAL